VEDEKVLQPEFGLASVLPSYDLGMRFPCVAHHVSTPRVLLGGSKGKWGVRAALSNQSRSSEGSTLPVESSRIAVGSAVAWRRENEMGLRVKGFIGLLRHGVSDVAVKVWHHVERRVGTMWWVVSRARLMVTAAMM
jgi:hypothetical protein